MCGGRKKHKKAESIPNLFLYSLKTADQVELFRRSDLAHIIQEVLTLGRIHVNTQLGGNYSRRCNRYVEKGGWYNTFAHDLYKVEYELKSWWLGAGGWTEERLCIYQGEYNELFYLQLDHSVLKWDIKTLLTESMTFGAVSTTKQGFVAVGGAKIFSYLCLEKIDIITEILSNITKVLKDYIQMEEERIMNESIAQELAIHVKKEEELAPLKKALYTIRY